MTTVDTDWWRGAVIYQIYPRSYQDSTGDGTGDLNGITARLPYIASLNVDAIWISPFFTSPMKDFGYDVSDYCDVDPMFGTLADFDRLIETAHGLGLKVMIDQVLSHSSDAHPWFAESRASRDNPRSDWYVWADAKPDGTPPNNWLSIFGGPAWQWDTRREQYYLHNFLVSQPDFNLHNPDVQDALLDTCRFWLDRGVDGFRLDTINFYFADKALRDNPALPPDERDDQIAPRVNPYNHQRHVHSKNQPENIAFIERFRALLDDYPAATSVGEVGDAQIGLELMQEYTEGNARAHMCYSFEFLSSQVLDAPRLQQIFARMAAVDRGGWACWALSNHDIPRHASRWQLSDAAQRQYLNLLVCLRGSLCLYQGEELGLPEAEVAYEDLQDPYGIAFWPEFKGRDGCRTPMVWDAEAPHGGFTAGTPWLPTSADHLPRAVSAQESRNDALLHHYREALAFRRAQPALVKGTQSTIAVEGTVAHFQRQHDGQTLWCALNLGAEAVAVTVPEGQWTLLTGLPDAATELAETVRLAGYQTVVAEQEG
ncbi:MAG: alpha-amylase family glycosyl hydrolase [Pseudomonadota bacterium]